MAIEELIAIYNLDLKNVNIKEFPFLSSANLHSLGVGREMVTPL